MRDYEEYINTLRKCAKEHENDIIFTGHTVVTALCRDTADLLEEIKETAISAFNANLQLEHKLNKAYSDGANDTIDKVLEIVDDCNSDGLKGIFCSYDDGERFKKDIKHLRLSITPVEQEAHWEHIKDRFGQHHIVCPCCKYREREYLTFSRKYCPNCGVKMREEE